MEPTQHMNLTQHFETIIEEVVNLKASYPKDANRIQNALNDLTHAQILIDNVLM